MKKQKKQFIFLGILLIIVIAAYAGIKLYNKNHSDEENAVSYPITQSDSSSVTEFTVTNENGSFSFIKEEDTWYYTEDRAFKVDTGALDEMITSAVSMSSEDKADNISDLSQYGLTSPSVIVTYTTGTESVTLNIGDYNLTISKYYVALKDSSTVYTIDSSSYSLFSKQLDDLKAVETENSDN